MTEDIGWVELGVKADTSGFDSSLSRGIGPSMDSVSRSAGSRFSAGFKKAIVAGSVGLVGAGTLAVKFAADAIGEAREAQKVGAQTNAVLKSTGGIAKVTEKDIGRLASQLSRKAGVDDELIQSGENVLLTFTGIRNEVGKNNDIFNQATGIALDMSTALGTDLQGSVIQVGKALNDPIKGITALQRVGVSFTEHQKKQIKGMVESGHTLKAQKTILAELTKEFGGSAKSQANNADKLTVAWGNLKEEVGKKLLPYLDDLAKFIRKEGIPAAKDFFDWVEDKGVPAMKHFGGFVKDVAGHVKDLVGFLKDLPDPAKYAGLAALVSGGAALKLRGGSGGALGTLGRVTGLAKGQPVYVTNWEMIRGGGVGVGGVGGKGPRAINAVPLVGSLAVGGEVLKESGIPQAVSHKLFGTNDNSALVKAILDDDTEALAKLAGQIKDTNKDWDSFEFNAKGAFTGIEKAINNATPLVKRYQDVLGQTPKQIATTFQLNGIDRAIQQADTLNAKLRAAADTTRGLDNGVTYAHGGQDVDGRIAANGARR